jgi:hypothetical protein
MKATKLQHRQQQAAASTTPVFETKKAITSSSMANYRVPSLLFLSSETNHPPSATAVAPIDVEDARNDTTTTTTNNNNNNLVESSPKVMAEKKEPRKSHLMMNIGRNNHAKRNTESAPGRKSASHKRDLPEGEMTGTTTTILTSPAAGGSTPSSSNTLSRLLFTKQHMEQRDQMKVVYTQFGPSALDLLTVEPDNGGIPSPEHADHVVVKVQVRVNWLSV